MTLADTIVYATCPEGYHFHSGVFSITIRCGDHSQWNNTLLECTPILCSSPPHIVGATIEWSNETAFGSTVMYTCFQGLRLEDGNTLMLATCQWNSQWNFTSRSCKGTFCLSM